MARGRYNPNPAGYGRLRDQAWPSQIAAQRPALVTRIQCDEPAEEVDANRTIRGSSVNYEGEVEGEGRLAIFNRQLRRGHAETIDDRDEEFYR